MSSSKWMVVVGAFLVSACAAEGSSSEPLGPCTGSETRCDGNEFHVCNGDQFERSETCAGTSTCDIELGCVQCRPSEVRACVGEDVYECNEDGSLGNYLETCNFEQCNLGACGGTSSSCEQGTTTNIYVVDSARNLLSFNPEKISSQPFELIGSLNCPAGPNWPDFDPLMGQSTPFSMSVDREGTAWVLYSSGEVFHVSTVDASCEPTSWVPGSGGYQLFGMGFVSDSEGSDSETLYIAGGAAINLVAGTLGTIDKNSLSVGTVGSLPLEEQSPELTGTGDGKLYGYWPGTLAPKIASLNTATGAQGENGEDWALPGLASTASAWAFAQWGGKFYVFVTSGFVPQNNVLEVDPSTGATTTVVADSPYRVVGAGVSTCAPTRID